MALQNETLVPVGPQFLTGTGQPGLLGWQPLHHLQLLCNHHHIHLEGATPLLGTAWSRVTRQMASFWELLAVAPFLLSLPSQSLLLGSPLAHCKHEKCILGSL